MYNEMNEQNLIPNSQRTPEQLREQTRKGGIASGKARLRKKHGKELVRALLALPPNDPRIIAQLEALGLNAKDITNEVAMHARQIEKAQKTADTKAYNAVNKIAGYVEEDAAAKATVVINVTPAEKAAADKWAK